MRLRSPVYAKPPKSRDLSTSSEPASSENVEVATPPPYSTEDSAPSATPDTGGVVLHRPSGERWVVAYVSGDRLAWCGWPSGVATLGECTLVKRATCDQRLKLLADMASMSEADHRRTYALHTLAEEVPPADH
jgi:hypothetical protein